MYCVPYLYFDAHIIYIDVPRAELHSECGLVVGLEATFCEPEEEARLSDTWDRGWSTGVSDDNELEHEVIVICHIRFNDVVEMNQI